MAQQCILNRIWLTDSSGWVHIEILPEHYEDDDDHKTIFRWINNGEKILNKNIDLTQKT